MFQIRNYLLVMFILLKVLGLECQAPDWQWVSQAGGTSYESANAIAIDADGNSYVTGSYRLTSSFGSYALSAVDLDDVFVTMLGPNGGFLWVASAGGTNYDQGYGISTDNFGNCYVTGSFRGTATFGEFTLTVADPNSISTDIFVAKLDNLGNWLWAISAGSTSYDDSYDIATDSNGNSYITGSYYTAISFGSHALDGVDGYQTFVAKLDSDGNWLWAQTVLGSSNNYGYGIAIDNFQNSYVTGRFGGATAVFGTTTLSNLAGGHDIFVAKLNPEGNWLWAKRAGGSASTDAMGYAIATSANGNSYISGNFYGVSDFGSTTLGDSANSGSPAIFVAKLDTNGNWLWANQSVGYYSTCYGISIDSAGYSYITGYFQQTVAFGDISLTSYAGSADVLIAKLGLNGSWLWVERAGGGAGDTGNDIVTDGAGNSYVTGVFSAVAEFGSTTLTAVGNFARPDMFFVKLSTGAVAVDDDIAPELPAQSCLYGAEPNPFRSGGITTIKTDIATGETGTLNIYNLRGELISSHKLSSGKHQISLDSRGLSSGIYLSQLRTQTVNTVRKMTLTK